MRPVLSLAALAVMFVPIFDHARSAGTAWLGEVDRGARPRPMIDPTVTPEARAAAQLAILRAARAEARKQVGRQRGVQAAVAGSSWVNLGPVDGQLVYQGIPLSRIGAGRVSAIRVDPRDHDVVYVATAGGGVWKTWSFGATRPSWHPITEMLGSLQIGALDLDPQNPDTIYLGLGDFVDGLAGAVVRSRDGGQSWDDPVALAGTYPPPAGGRTRAAASVRDLRVDPTNASIVLAATDIGLFRSTDAGAHFELTDLPNPGPFALEEGVWSLAYVGAAGGLSHWVASGVQACDRGRRAPAIALGLPPGTYCRLGNLGDIWRSSDGGATWTSARSAGALPLPPEELGRMTLGVGNPADPARTVLYAMAETVDEGAAGGANRTVDFLRSTDGGVSFVSVRGTLSNPIRFQDGYDCRDLDLGHNQSWYNQAVAVDPTDDGHVLVGGQVCGMRTTNGTAATPRWDNVSFTIAENVVRCGALPYVHPDWHAALVLREGAGVRVYAGTDGGVCTSTNLFEARAGRECDVEWTDRNFGIVAQQLYSLASGDPALSNPDLTYAGAQDTGTLYRSRRQPTHFDMVSSGDGVGTTATPEIYWYSVFLLGPGSVRMYCKPAQADCGVYESWTAADPTLPAGDASTFQVRFSPVQTEPGGVVLTHSNYNVWRSDATGATPTWTSIGSFARVIQNVFASQTTPGLYGVALANGRFAVTADGNRAAPAWTVSATQIGVGPAPSQRLRGSSSIAFPPAAPAGTSPGDVYVAASNAPTLDDGSPVPESIGHLFLTRDRGTTWTPLGAGLPNVPIEVVRYDPGDDAGATLYVGTEIGVYRTTDGAASWERFGQGLPMARVTDLYVARNSSLLRVATFGRGIWEIYPTAMPRGVPGDGDFNRDQKLDFVDLAAMTARLGTTPASAAAPHYSWYCDMTGDASAIDDADLEELLAGFGGHP